MLAGHVDKGSREANHCREARTCQAAAVGTICAPGFWAQLSLTGEAP